VLLVSGFNPSVARASGIKAYVMALSRELVRLGQDVSLLGVGSEPAEIEGMDFIPVVDSIQSSFDFVRALNRYVRNNQGLEGLVHAQRPDDLVPFHRKAKRLPKVVTLHGVHSIHVRARRGALAAWAYRRAERYSLARTAAAICVSKDTLGYFRSRYPRLMPAFKMIPAGIDLSLFIPHDKAKVREEIGIAPNCKLVTFVGRFEPEKNPGLILNEYLSLHGRHSDAHLAMIGNGQLADDLRDLSRTVKGLVDIIDPMPQEGLARFLSASNVIVVASRHEGLPTVALEALACGTPVVGTRVGILPDVIKNGSNGYVVDSLGELGRYVEKALYQTDWEVDKCRESVREFGWDRVAPAILDTYRSARKQGQGGE